MFYLKHTRLTALILLQHHVFLHKALSAKDQKMIEIHDFCQQVLGFCVLVVKVLVESLLSKIRRAGPGK